MYISLLILSFLIVCRGSASLRALLTNRRGLLVLGLSAGTNNMEQFWKSEIEYIDTMDENSHISGETREFSLFVLGNVFYPQGITYMNVFEMKYR